MEELKKEGKTIVIVTHALNKVEELCTRAIWIKDGKIEMDGKVDEVLPVYIKVCG